MSFVWIASLLFLTTSSLSYLCFIFCQSHNKDRETILSVNEKAVFITAVFCTLMFTALLYSKIGSHEDVIVAQLLENETPSSEDSEINEELIDNMRRSLDKRPQNVLYGFCWQTMKSLKETLMPHPSFMILLYHIPLTIQICYRNMLKTYF